VVALRLVIVAAAALLALVGAASRAGNARAQQPHAAGLPAATVRSVTITIPKTKYNFGERFRACITFPTPASIVLTRKMPGQLTVRDFPPLRRRAAARQSAVLRHRRRDE